MATKQLEKDIQDAIIQWLGYQPSTFVWRQNAGMRVSEYKGTRHVFRAASVAGISDIIGVWNGKPLAIEVKRPGGKPTESQLQFLNDFARAGGIAMVVYDVSQVQEVFNQITEAKEKANAGTFSRFTNYTLKEPPKKPTRTAKSTKVPSVALEKGDRQ